MKTLFQYRDALFSTTKFEFKKRYAGSGFGTIWVILYPILFLSVYLFLYLAVFKLSYPNLNELEAVIYIFSGLVPYIAFMETATTSTTILKQNVHLLKNVVLPLSLVPTRVALMAMITQIVSLTIILILSAINGSISINLIILPFALLTQFFFILGIAYLLSPLGLIAPDINYFVSLSTLLLLFVSPIGFMSSMLSTKMQLVVWANPIYYILLPFRMAFLPADHYPMVGLVISFLVALASYSFGVFMFRKFTTFAIEYE